MLAVDIQKRVGDLDMAIAFESEGLVTGLFGPSGAGKSTLVNMIAGLVAPDRGRIALDGTVLFDVQSGINLPAYQRHIGYVFQEGRLFPHMTVRKNLDYGRWMAGIAPDQDGMKRIVAMLDIEPLLQRRPGKLSGGERQRVAIGRALMMKPRLLLLDEPLASLDPARKAEIMPYLIRLRDEARIPMVYVSHYARELKRIANVIVRIEAGRVTAFGGPDILTRSDEEAFA
ncbi:molybdenum ABC transporter ATP-binding protein [Pseudorhodoplanes sinuspersici]|uniref:Molybdenum ABC transporter ATP-binding protein n=1 Tax=Pseudorhodoplanes sinuspersici TaxID=1235591 RepID=A0A1W6ZNN7_9HYPH|nr:molybdenum ABC transporter ATP-binding protein [Pseudorhodoplanes sinuspersici]ARP98847.1 molybdenum ABC transporter ATP-binding protein [Pseudorhodoplanes sinuspersici]